MPRLQCIQLVVLITLFGLFCNLIGATTFLQWGQVRYRHDTRAHDDVIFLFCNNKWHHHGLLAWHQTPTLPCSGLVSQARPTSAKKGRVWWTTVQSRCSILSHDALHHCLSTNSSLENNETELGHLFRYCRSCKNTTSQGACLLRNR